MQLHIKLHKSLTSFILFSTQKKQLLSAFLSLHQFQHSLPRAVKLFKYIKGSTDSERPTPHQSLRYNCYQKHVQNSGNVGNVFGNMPEWGRLLRPHGRLRLLTRPQSFRTWFSPPTNHLPRCIFTGECLNAKECLEDLRRNGTKLASTCFVWKGTLFDS